MLKLISFGKYRTPLYYKGSDSYSSVMGGILAIIGMITLLNFCVFILKDIISPENFSIKQ
jgi:hypothetical protein